MKLLGGVSDADEGLGETRQKPFEAQRCVGGGQTDAGFALLGNGRVMQVFIGDFDIAAREPTVYKR